MILRINNNLIFKVMRNLTFVALLLSGFSLTASAELQDRYFYKIATDKMDNGWIVQDKSNFVSTPGKEYLTVTNNKNGGRMLNYFWNDAAWSRISDLSTLPNSTYKFTMDLNMTNMAARSDMEFVLLPVNACTSTDNRVKDHNNHWWKAEDGDDYFFRWRVVTKPTVANGNYTICINEDPTKSNDWSSYTETVELSSQKTYKYEVEINASTNTATYTISDEEGALVKSGSHVYTCEEDRAGIFVFSMNGTSTHQLSNIGLSYKAEGPFATEPNVELFSVFGEERDYFVTFNEGEVLHWKQLGDAEDVNENKFTSGQEYSVTYENAYDTRNFETDIDNKGHKILYCTQSGDLEVWTTLEDGKNPSDYVVTPVECGKISMPTPEVKISNVSEGYAKEYTIIADNSKTLLAPTVTIHYLIKDASGSVISEKKDALSGDVVKMMQPGTLELYAYDGTHPAAYPWYSPSETVTISNDIEYQIAETVNYAWTKEECSTTKAGFSVSEIVDNANKSHWDRIYSDQMYGYDAQGGVAECTEANASGFVSTKKGYGFYAGSAIGTDDAKWKVQTPDDAITAFAPLSPTADFVANSKYDATAWGIFPYEGIVYYNTALTTADFQLDPKYTSDDPNRPNIYIVHTRNTYDRPDKGDCNATTVCVAGETYKLNRYDTALCDVKVYTYKGFNPNTGISSVDAEDTKSFSASTVKKVVTKNGIVLVKDGKMYSISGAQIK